MQRLNSVPFFAMALLGAFALPGCGESGPEYDTQHVEGVVTLDGEPVAGATVTFAPVEEGQGVPATGTTDEAGRYTLTTVGGGLVGEDGAGTTAGEYYVGVVKNQLPSGPETTEDPGYGEDTEEQDQPEVTFLVPQKYNSPRQSGLKVTVQEGDNNIPIELTSK